MTLVITMMLLTIYTGHHIQACNSYYRLIHNLIPCVLNCRHFKRLLNSEIIQVRNWNSRIG
jgi:hypothetical protein